MGVEPQKKERTLYAKMQINLYKNDARTQRRIQKVERMVGWSVLGTGTTLKKAVSLIIKSEAACKFRHQRVEFYLPL